MNIKKTIKIKKSVDSRGFCRFLLLFPFTFGLLNDLLGLPNAIKYGMDVVWVTAVLLMVLYRRRLDTSRIRILLLWVLLFLIATFLTYIPRWQSGLYYLWGLRNSFRLYGAFFAWCVLMREEDAWDCLKILDNLFWLSFGVVLIQYLLLGKTDDYLGGIFGTQKGCNGFTNLFLCIMVTKSLVFCLHRREKVGACLMKVAVAMVIAALAELKFFFVEALLILLMAVCLAPLRRRNLLLILGGATAVAFGVLVLEWVFPNYSGFFSWSWMWEAASASRGYTSSGDFNRLNAIARINDRFLLHWWDRLFGLGLGNCETSAFAVLNTPFFRKYGHLHYSWMSHAFWYLECGWLGLSFYMGFFVLLFFKIRTVERNWGDARLPLCKTARIMALLCPLIAVYNSSLRTEAGYMVYFILAIPFMNCAAGKGEKES